MIDQVKIIDQLKKISKVDPQLAQALETYGYPEPRIREKGFKTLFSIVISQQLSIHAAKAIMKRAMGLFDNDISAYNVNNKSFEELRSIGLSKQKINYVQGLSSAIIEKQFDVDNLNRLNDAQVKSQITQLKGFGPWSAEIYMMFSLHREDIFPEGDLALQLALQRLKSLTERPTPKQAAQLIQHWSPWRTAGSLFLWHYYKGAPT